MKFRFQLHLLLLLGSVPAFAGPGSPVFQGNNRHTGIVTEHTVTGIDGIRWRFRTGGAIRGTPALSEGTLYCPGGDGSLYAVRAATGAELWRFKTEGALFSSPAVDHGTVFVAGRTNALYAVNAATGTLKWKYRFGADLPYKNGFDNYCSSPIVENGTVYVGSGDGNLYAVDAARGTVRWKYDTGSRIRSTPAIADGKLFVGTMGGHLLALDGKSGKLLWKFVTDGAGMKFEDYGFDRSAIVSSPTIDAGKVFVGCRDGILYAVDIASGKESWRNDHQVSWVISTPMVSKGTVYCGSSDARFFQSVGADSGKDRWRFDTKDVVWSSGALAGSTLIFGDYSGMIYGVDVRAGKERWRFPLGDRLYSSPVISDSTLYYGSDDGTLYALRCSFGESEPDTLRRAVYWAKLPGFTWFQRGVDTWMRDYFSAQDYRVLDTAGLQQFMLAQIANPGRSVLILANNDLPKAFADTTNGLARRYLESGGRLVFLGPNPVGLRRDSAGAFLGINFRYAEKVFGMKYPGRGFDAIGWYQSQTTAAGLRWGLDEWCVSLGWVDPAQVDEMLSRDEYGNASAWVKYFGAARTGSLLQLAVPRDTPVNLAPILRAVEHGIR